MTAPRVEQVVDEVVTVLTGLTTTGNNVFRGIDRDLKESEVPALKIGQGRDARVQQYQHGASDWDVDVVVVAVAQAASEDLETDLNAIRGEVIAALMADHTLGLDFVKNCDEGPAEEVQRSGAGHKPTGELAMNWTIRYRRSDTDPTA